MRAHLQYLRERLRRSFWLLPSLMTLSALIAAPLSLQLDASPLGRSLAESSGLLNMRAEGARLILSTIAGSMMTVASLVFSLTLVALTLAAGSIGARLLDRYMGSRVIQVALGLFLATFVYALLVLSGVDANQENGVPQISTVLTMALAVASFGWLIYFIHSLAAGIQVDNVIADVADQVTKEVRRLGTRGFAQESREECTAPDLGGRQPTLEVGAAASGYLQTLDAEGLVDVAAEAALLLEVLVRPGHFVLEDLPVVRVFGEVADAAALTRRLQGLMVLGPRRTAAQDVEFSLNLLVEIAARALSPGVNDYYTALACVDHIAAALAALTRTGLPAAVRADGDGQVRVLLVVPSFSDFADAALDPLRQCARDNLPVSIRLLENLCMLAQCAHDPEVHRVLLRHGELIADSALAAARADKDREDVAERLADLQAVLEC